MLANICMCLICLITIFVKAGHPLKCWTCSSILEPGCDDPFNPEELSTGVQYFLLDCNAFNVPMGLLTLNESLDEQHLIDHVFGPGAKEYCRKTVREIYGMTIVFRGCSIGDTDISKDCSGSSKEVCVSAACFEDGCNTATRLGLSLFIQIFMLCSFLT